MSQLFYRTKHNIDNEIKYTKSAIKKILFLFLLLTATGIVIKYHFTTTKNTTEQNGVVVSY